MALLQASKADITDRDLEQDTALLVSFDQGGDGHLWAPSLIPPEPRSRSDIANPVILGDVMDISGDNRIFMNHGLVVKPAGSMDFAVPETFDFLFEAGLAVAQDAFALYGAEKFRDAEIVLIAQRTETENGKAQRGIFGHWHTHDKPEGKGRNRVDFIYGFCDDLGTEFRNAHGQKQTRPGTLTRWGAEIEHRGVVNNTGQTLNRTWGAFLVYPKAGYREAVSNPAFNRAVTPRIRDSFHQAGNRYLAFQQGKHFNPRAPEPVLVPDHTL